MNYNPHDGEQKPEAEADPQADDCGCVTCTVRRALQQKYPDGLDAKARSEIRSGIAHITAALLADVTPEERQEFDDRVERQIRRIKIRDQIQAVMEEAFSGTGAAIIIRL